MAINSQHIAFIIKYVLHFVTLSLLFTTIVAITLFFGEKTPLLPGTVTLTLSMSMLFRTSWPDNEAVQLLGERSEPHIGVFNRDFGMSVCMSVVS